MARAQGGVPRERQLTTWTEDADGVVGVGIRRGADEGRLGKVRPGGELVHALGGDPGRIQHHCDGIAEEGLRCEDIDLGERMRDDHAPSLPWDGISRTHGQR